MWCRGYHGRLSSVYKPPVDPGSIPGIGKVLLVSLVVFFAEELPVVSNLPKIWI